MKKNQVQLIGNLGTEVETKNLENGQVSNFSMATSEKYKNKKGEVVEDTQWHNIVLWNKTSELAEKYLKKGDKVGISGKLVTRTWDDKDGNKRYTTEVVANSILMLGSNKASSDNSEPNQSKNPTEGEEDDLPF